MRFAFLIMGKFDSREDQAVIHNGTARIIGVSDLEDAARTAKRLEEEGIDCIELCGAFREEGARAVIEATGNRIPVGYVTHLPGRRLPENKIRTENGDPARDPRYF